MKRIIVLLFCLLSPAVHAERILVQPRPGLAQADLDNKLAAVLGRRVDYIHQINVHVIELPDRADPRAAAALLNADRHDINFAEVDERVAPTLLPNDPGFSSEWYATKLGAPTAWNYANGSGVIVAILDSGVDSAHPDLASNMVSGYNFYDNNTDTRDVYGHGTKVAGTVAMVANNLKGGAGIAFGARIMPIRVTDTSGYGYYSAMAKGITWAADNGARAANLSFLNVCGSSAIHSAANYMRGRGGVVTASAGNTGVLESLAVSSTITCVSATDSTDNRTSWSSYGDYVDVAAPGAAIYTTVRGGTYGSVYGTSFSAPITAAVYALMMSVNRALTPSQLDSILFSTAKDLGTAGKDRYYGYGRVDAAAAIAKAYVTTAASDSTAPSVAITSPQAGATVAGTVVVNVSATDNVGVSRVDFYAGGTFIASDTVGPYAFSWNTALRGDGSVVLEARAFDAKGNVGYHKVSVTVANNTNSGGGNLSPGSTNFALASAGAVATASSAYSAGYPVAAVNDGLRTGANWGNGGGWNDATPGAFPDWVQINFNGAKSVDRVVVYTVQDNYTTLEPTDSMTFSQHGVVDFTVQGWNGSSWVTLGSVTGNNLVKRTVSFSAFTTDRIRVRITRVLNYYSRIIEIEAWGQAALPATTNVALGSAGAVASASSTYSSMYPVAAVNDGLRTGANWGNGGGWNDATPGAVPDWVQINFNGAKSVDRVVVYTVQDNYTTLEPTDSMTFSQHGVVDFTVQGWNGSSWVTLGSVTGNNLVKRTVSFSAFTTDRIRVRITRVLNYYSRITEIEAWGK